MEHNHDHTHDHAHDHSHEHHDHAETTGEKVVQHLLAGSDEKTQVTTEAGALDFENGREQTEAHAKLNNLEQLEEKKNKQRTGKNKEATADTCNCLIF